MNTNLRLLLMLTTMLCTACSQVTPHHNIPVIALSSLSSDSYSSTLETVVAASNRYNPHSIAEDREYMGAVLRQGSSYRYTVAQGEIGSDSISLQLAIPAGMEVVAFWHTHGAEHFSRQYFSDTDSKLVRQWAKPFYMANHSGNLRVLKPGHYNLPTLQAARLGLGRHSGYAEGEQVKGENGSLVRVATTITTDVKLVTNHY